MQKKFDHLTNVELGGNGYLQTIFHVLDILMELPRSHRRRALSDSATGWFTIRDKKGTLFAEAES